jgi:hypothetical protein
MTMLNKRAFFLATSVGAILQVCGVVAGPTARAATAPSYAPRVTTSDVAWLAGSWRGNLPGSDALPEVMFAEPRAGMVNGVMRLTQAYETDFRQAMRLTVHEADRDVFENEVPFTPGVPSTQPRVSTFTHHADEFVGHSDTMGDDGRPGAVEVIYHRVR